MFTFSLSVMRARGGIGGLPVASILSASLSGAEGEGRQLSSKCTWPQERVLQRAGLPTGKTPIGLFSSFNLSGFPRGSDHSLGNVAVIIKMSGLGHPRLGGLWVIGGLLRVRSIV